MFHCILVFKIMVNTTNFHRPIDSLRFNRPNTTRKVVIVCNVIFIRVCLNKRGFPSFLSSAQIMQRIESHLI